MTQIGGFTAVYDMLNLRQGMPASCFVRLVRLRVACLGLRDTIFKAGVCCFIFFYFFSFLFFQLYGCLGMLLLLFAFGVHRDAAVLNFKQFLFDESHWQIILENISQ